MALRVWISWNHSSSKAAEGKRSVPPFQAHTKEILEDKWCRSDVRAAPFTQTSDV